jgi:acylphosphatase
MGVNLKIYGLVQGVFFRHSAKQKAQELGLTGWIKNNPDGSVEAQAQGDEAKLKEFIAWCGLGPPSAKVEKVDVNWKELAPEFNDFLILN